MAPGRGDVIVAGAAILVADDAAVRHRARARERDRHPRRLGPRDARRVTSAAVCRIAPGTSSSRSWRRAGRPSGTRPSAAATSRWAWWGASWGSALLVVGYMVLTGDDDATQASDAPRPRRRPRSEPSGEPGTRSGAVAPVAQPPASVACNGEAPADAGGEDATVRRTAADDDRRAGDLHGHLRRRRAARSRSAASRHRAGSGEQLRLPRSAGLLRRAHVPSHRRRAS